MNQVRSLFTVGFFVATLTSTGCPSYADRLVLRDGRIIQGKLIAQTKESLYVKPYGSDSIRTIRCDQVVQVIKAPPPKPRPVVPASAPAIPSSLPAPHGPLASPESLADALRPDRRGIPLPEAPADPRKDPEWRKLTALQQEEQLARYARKLREHQARLAPQEPSPAFRGKNVSWTLEVREISRDPNGPGFLVTAASRRGYLVSAPLPPDQKQTLLRVKKFEPLQLSGTIEAYKFEEKREQATFCPQVDVSFGVLLKDAKAALPDDASRKRFYSPDSAENCIVFLVDMSGSIVACFDDARFALLRGHERIT